MYSANRSCIEGLTDFAKSCVATHISEDMDRLTDCVGQCTICRSRERKQKILSNNFFCTTILDLCYKFQVPNFKTLYGWICTFLAKILNRFDIIFDSNFIYLREGLFKLTELFTGVSMRTHSAIHRRSSDYPKNNFLSLEFAMGQIWKLRKC